MTLHACQIVYSRVVLISHSIPWNSLKAFSLIDGSVGC